MKLRKWLDSRSRGDDGVALVAAVAVAIIGVMITVVVVSQAVTLTNDTQRDRVRTLEVHSAESALDTMMAELATTAPCPGPDWSPATVGEGTQATIVTVVIDYFASGSQLDCVNGNLSGVPSQAVITATAVPAEPGPGIPPKRAVQSTVNLVPNSEMIPGAALFSGSTVQTGGGFMILPADASNPAGVWIDNGNWVCNTNVKITGDLYVVNGNATMQNGCTVSGDMWVKGTYTNCCTVPNNVFQVGENLTVRTGGLTLNNPTRVGGDLKVAGNVPVGTGHWNNSFFGGSSCAANLPTQCTSFQDFGTVGLPQIDFVLDDWQPTEAGVYFTLKHKEDFGNAVLHSWGYQNLPESDYRVKQIKDKPCYIPGWMTSAPVKLPFPGSNTATVFDMRDCAFEPNNPVKIELYADIAIFANKFYGSNGLVVVSGDGQPHKLWMIVPWGSGANGKGSKTITVNGKSVNYTPGTVAFDTGLVVTKPVSLFLYTPSDLRFPNKSDTYGQLYGGSVTIGEGNGKFYYSPMGMPGVDLNIPTATASGFRVEIINKKELHD